MPVFSNVTDGVLIVTVDGDYTSNELQRVGAGALDDLEAPAPVLLDMSGAAGLSKRSTEQLVATAEFFAGHREKMTRVGILAPGDLAFGLMSMGSTVASLEGLDARPFRSRAEAMAWLTEAD